MKNKESKFDIQDPMPVTIEKDDTPKKTLLDLFNKCDEFIKPYILSSDDILDKVSCSMWGTNLVELTKEDIDALKSGKILQICDGEYQTFVRINDGQK